MNSTIGDFMKIYDITQELFTSNVYKGDQPPGFETVSDIRKGASYNLSNLHMCVHNGTHLDAPYHFIKDGKTIDQMSLNRCVGNCTVVEYNGRLTKEDVIKIRKQSHERLLFKGDVVITLEAAIAINECGFVLIGVESQSVGEVDAPMPVHIELLNEEVAILEGLVLKEVPEGNYMLNAAPIKLGGLDGAPCRALLIQN